MSEPRHAATTDPADEYSADVTENPHHDDEDTAVLLEQETEGGEGGSAPKADFVSYEDPSCDTQEGSG